MVSTDYTVTGYLAVNTLEMNICEALAVAVRWLYGLDTAPACPAGEAVDLASDFRLTVPFEAGQVNWCFGTRRSHWASRSEATHPFMSLDGTIN